MVSREIGVRSIVATRTEIPPRGAEEGGGWEGGSARERAPRTYIRLPSILRTFDASARPLTSPGSVLAWNCTQRETSRQLEAVMLSSGAINEPGPTLGKFSTSLLTVFNSPRDVHSRARAREKRNACTDQRNRGYRRVSLVLWTLLRRQMLRILKNCLSYSLTKHLSTEESIFSRI